MGRKKEPESKLLPTALPKSGMAMGNGGGALDTSTLPRPKLEPWAGWASAPQERK
jgi:hypothetical protein